MVCYGHSCKHIYFKIILSKAINKVNWSGWWQYLKGVAKFYWHANDHSLVLQSESLCKLDSAASHTKTDQNAVGAAKRCHSIKRFEDISFICFFFLLNSHWKKQFESVLRSDNCIISMETTKVQNHRPTKGEREGSFMLSCLKTLTRYRALCFPFQPKTQNFWNENSSYGIFPKTSTEDPEIVEFSKCNLELASKTFESNFRSILGFHQSCPEISHFLTNSAVM